MTLVYITCRDSKEAEKISLGLLRKKLIACSNMFPVRSMYRDKKIVKENEFVIIAKTNKKNFRNVLAETRKMHSYRIPCILKLEALANMDYEQWAESLMR